MDKTYAFIACLIYDLLFTALILYLIAFKGWSIWTYLLAIVEGHGVCYTFYKTYGIKDKN